MIRLRAMATVSLAVLALSACTLAPLDRAATGVRVMSAVPAGCTELSEVEVSVTGNVGPIDRNALRVKDELETLARNEAAKQGGNAVVAVSGPEMGEQRFKVYRCP